MMRTIPKIVFSIILSLLNFTLVFPNGSSHANEKSVQTFHIVLPVDAVSELKSIASIFERQILQRCDAVHLTYGNIDLSIELKVDKSIGSETFQIENGESGVVHINGGDSRGVLFGIGKFLRSSRFTEDGFVPGTWRGTSAPDNPVRAFYLATHYGNFYEAAPIEEVVQYIQDLGLWGYNTILIHYPTFQFDDLQSEPSQIWLKRFNEIFASAKKYGLQIGLIQCVNQGFKSTPDSLRGTKVPGNHRGNFGVNLCPSIPKAQEVLIDLYSNLLDQFAEIPLDYFILWPYDEGGCGCSQCWPWGGRGFLKLSREMETLIHKKFPESKIILSTWSFENEDNNNPDGEWTGLEKYLQHDNSWVDYIMADGHGNYFPKYLLEQGVPGNLPLLNFPEISMFGMVPWGGYGSNPAPDHFQQLWDRIKHMANGGAPYSEGIYEDINKSIIAGFYWNRERKAEDVVREYLSFEFSPDVAQDLMKVVKIFEQNHDRNYILNHDRNNIHDSAILAFKLVSNAEIHLTQQVRSSWRWRIFYLRALIDKELYQRNGKLEGEVLKAAFAELKKIYYADNVNYLSLSPIEIH